MVRQSSFESVCPVDFMTFSTVLIAFNLLLITVNQ